MAATEGVPSAHAVRLYRDPAELAASVVSFLAEGFEAGEPAIVVATEEHARRFEASLAERGWVAGELEAAGLLQRVDADETLAAMLEDGVLSPARFEHSVGVLMDRAEVAADGRPIRVFGEMVDLLAARGDVRSAALLEQLWNGLLETRRFSLLCGYQVDLFDGDTQAELLPDVCREHSRVEVVDDPVRFQDAVEAALAETLGSRDAQKVYALVANQIREGRVPAAQLALMWVSAHMPRSAERVLELARARYFEQAPAT